MFPSINKPKPSTQSSENELNRLNGVGCHATNAYEIAQVYAFRNQPDEAFEWLERAYAQRDGGLPLTNIDPLLKNLRSDPRYAAFLKKIRLPA